MRVNYSIAFEDENGKKQKIDNLPVEIHEDTTPEKMFETAQSILEALNIKGEPHMAVPEGNKFPIFCFECKL